VSGSARSVVEGQPQLAVVVRAGDAQAGIAVAVTTEGVAPARGAVPAVALAALIEARLANLAGTPEEAPVVAVGGWEGFRLRALVATPSQVPLLLDSVRRVMLAPVASDEAALAAVRHKVEALGRRTLPDRAMAFVARCTGEAFGLGGETAPTVEELETWRRAALGSQRVAFAVVGDEAFAAAATDDLASAPPWPSASPRTFDPWPEVDEPPVTYDASSELPAGAARIIVVARSATPERAVSSATTVGEQQGPLASRLAALDAPARVRSVVATAHGDGGCVAVTLDLSARELQKDAPARVATAAALARQEVTVELAEAPSGGDVGASLAQRAADPRDAAERAAWWSLSGRSHEQEPGLRVAIAVGLAAPRDAGTSPVLPAAALRAELDRATIAWHSPVVEGRARVERGQGETWVLLASPCGTLGEEADAGSGATVVTAAALSASAHAGDALVEPFVAPDGIGVLAHGPPRAGETPQAHGRRLADLAARAFAADALDRRSTTQARTALLARTSETEARLLGAAGAALTAGHASWIVPLGTTLGVASISDDDAEERAAALRAGPLRVAVLASSDASQADAVVRAVDRWVARRPGEVRACPVPSATRPRPATYAITLPTGARSEALLALSVPARDDAARANATWLAAALDGADGLLARALGSPNGEDSRALASGWNASVAGAPQAPVLLVRVVSDDASLDAAVAQTRALLDRLRQGALKDEDRARAARAIARLELSASLDPGMRAIALWRGDTPPSPASRPPPTLDDLRLFAAATLRDETLVIVAARPPHADPKAPPPRDARLRGH
jgi:hypothetical protein